MRQHGCAYLWYLWQLRCGVNEIKYNLTPTEPVSYPDILMTYSFDLISHTPLNVYPNNEPFPPKYLTQELRLLSAPKSKVLRRIKMLGLPEAKN
jgi:hypothetical protein